MKKALIIVGSVVGACVLGSVIFMGYMGILGSVPITEKEMGPFNVVYESFVGEYKETGKVFGRLYESLKQDGVVTENGIGIYYDDPREVPKDQLRSDCACVLEADEVAKVEALGDKYQLKTIEKARSLVAEFPIRNILSYMFGPVKTYPALRKEAQARGIQTGTMYEYYDMQAKQILVVAPIIEPAKAEAVPEAETEAGPETAPAAESEQP